MENKTFQLELDYIGDDFASRKQDIVDADFRKEENCLKLSHFKATPSVKTNKKTYVYKQSDNIGYKSFELLLKNTRTSTFPILLMEIFVDKMSYDSNDLLELYKAILPQQELRKTLLAISSMRVVKDKRIQKNLLKLLKENKFCKQTAFKSAKNDLIEYWG